jgi:Fe-S cluster biogenesis protein NfuA
MEEVSVRLEFTPNPESLKYVVNRQLLAKGAQNFSSAATAKEFSGLASELFTVSGIKAVMLGTNFVVVSIQDPNGLMNLHEQIEPLIRDYLSSGKPVVEAAALASSQSPMPQTEIEKKIVEILDREVRPAVAMDGGDITFEKFEDGYVYVKMQGSCSGCPSSLMTLKMGVETRLKEAVPEVQEVIPV